MGAGWLKESCATLTAPCDANGLALGGFGGWQFNPYIGLEAGYDYFGDLATSYRQGNQITQLDGPVTALTLAPRFSLPLNDYLSLYGKAGVAWVNYDHAQDSSMMGALGVQIDATPRWMVRLEYQLIPNLDDSSYGLSDQQAGMASLSLSYRLGYTSPEPPATTPPMLIEKTFDESRGQQWFSFDSAAISESMKAQLNELAELLSSYPQARVDIKGYTDSSGPAAYNLRLSKRRAMAVEGYLLSRDVAAEQLFVEGFGEKEPITSNQTRQGRAKNRRVTITIHSFSYQATPEQQPTTPEANSES